MFGLELDWTFAPKKISKRVMKINFGENQVTKIRKVLQRNEANSEERNDIKDAVGCFNKAIAPVIFVSQIFGVLPIQGIFSSNVNDLKFTWSSPRTLYSIFGVSTIFWCLISEVRFFNRASSTQYIADFIAFFPLVFIISIKSITLAKRWPRLMRKWYDVEVAMAKYQFKNEPKTLIRKGRIMAALLVLSVLTIVSSRIGRDIRDVIKCYDAPERVNAFIRISASYIAYLRNNTSFSAFVAAIFARLQLAGIFIFMNYFMMMLCFGLISQFKMLNENLLVAKDMNMPLSYWVTVRGDYQRLVDLCRDVDDEISLFMAVTLLNEIYSIASRCFMAIKPMDSMLGYFMIWPFLGAQFMVCFGKMFLASKINDESQRPLKVLRAVPSESWNIEVQRFSEEVASNTVALSCLKVFFITRRGILSVFSTIVTYEIILSQLNFSSTFLRCAEKNSF